MQISSRAVMFWGCRWATRTFNSLQRISMGLRSGDWLGHSRTLKCFLRSHSFVARAVCLGSLSCWKTQPRFIFNALADGRRFSLKISRYMDPFFLSFTQISRPGPFAEKQPQSMMFPPPCFTVGMVFFGCNRAVVLESGLLSISIVSDLSWTRWYLDSDLSRTWSSDSCSHGQMFKLVSTESSNICFFYLSKQNH